MLAVLRTKKRRQQQSKQFVVTPERLDETLTTSEIILCSSGGITGPSGLSRTDEPRHPHLLAPTAPALQASTCDQIAVAVRP